MGMSVLCMVDNMRRLSSAEGLYAGPLVRHADGKPMKEPRPTAEVPGKVRFFRRRSTPVARPRSAQTLTRPLRSASIGYPDPRGWESGLRLTGDERVRLLDQGFEIRLHHAHPIRPLDPPADRDG